MEQICKSVQYAGCFVVEGPGIGGGLALMWKNGGGVDIKGSSNHYIDFEVYSDQLGRWRYTGFYGCPERSRRQESWSIIRELAGKSSLPWCMLGDFNDLIHASEKRGRRAHPRHLLEGFSDVVNECELIDLGFVGNDFTWEKSRGTDLWIQERLDRGLATQSWRDIFPQAEIQVLDVSTSDHLPLFLQVNKKVYVPRSKRFRFENMWIKEEDCYNLVQSSWNCMEGRDIVEKINFCCLKLDEWGGGKAKEMQKQIKVYRGELRRYRSRRDIYGINKYNEARSEYLKLLEKQEIYWKQRAKQFWLREGDQNSRFFHKYASGRKKNNQIQGLKNKGGEWKESKEDIQNIVVDYFTELFETTEGLRDLTERESVNRVTAEQNVDLMLPVTMEEVKNAVFSMHPEKAPGIDGLNPGFYQAYWRVVGTDVTELCQKFFSTGELPEGINRTLVCLIPKVKRPQQMQDLRPISLCNVLIRIISKVMANRLKSCLPGLISDKQSAFVEGRLLTDNALIAFELNHYLRRRTQGVHGVAGLKIDISKAYDRLEWDFVENMLKRFEFSREWIDRVLKCIKTVTYSFIHDGSVFGEVQPQRGIRQGDPISPYLYILCAEGLSSILRRSEKAGIIHGCTVARNAPPISHLLFADDSYFFFRASESEATSMKNILLRYEGISGQAINFNKSNVVFSKNTTSENREVVCRILEVNEVSVPGNYLGMPMHIGRRKMEVFNGLTDRVKRKLQGWKNKSISKAGKLTLLKTAAQSIPNFWMNLFLLPNEVCEGIHKQMNSFWWGNGGNGKGVRWCSWERMCMTKEAGGLGFRDLKKFNISMLAKQGWRLLNNENQLVTSLLKARYYPKCDFLDAKLGANPSFMWRSILAAQESIRKGCRKRIGNGKDTFAWKVPWLPCTENGYLTSSMHQELENIKVQSLMEVNTRAWDREVIHDIMNQRDEELILKIPLPEGDRQDAWFWCLETQGNFTVKSCYRMLQGTHALPDKFFWNKVWSIKLPGKVTNFLWRVSRSWLPTAAALAEKRVQIDTRCQWCLQSVETAVHVLFECPFAKSVWTDERVNIEIQVLQGDTVFQVLSRFFQKYANDQIVQVVMLCWSLWNRRNKWVWDKINMSPFGVQAQARNLLYDWRRMLLEKGTNTIVRQPSSRTWNPPPQGYVKINVDAAIFAETKHIGLGAVVRDEHGCFLRARGRQIAAEFLPREAEALSLKEALSWAVQAGYSKCVFETDAQLLVDACYGSKGRSYFHAIVSDCVDLFKHFCDVLVQFVHRSANEVAHVLARATHFMSDTQEWLAVAPDFMLETLNFDSI